VDFGASGDPLRHLESDYDCVLYKWVQPSTFIDDRIYCDRDGHDFERFQTSGFLARLATVQTRKKSRRTVSVTLGTKRKKRNQLKPGDRRENGPVING
jgi:hypothetical protein